MLEHELAHPHTLTFTADHVRRLRDHLVRDDGLERCAYAYCSPSGDRLLVEQLVLISDEDTIGQSATACRPSRDHELSLIGDCLRRGLQPCIIHSHPFSENIPWFSPMDTQLMQEFTSYLTGHTPDTTPMYAVFSQTGITAAIFPEAEDAQRHPLPVTVLGNDRLDPPLTGAADTLRTDPTLAYDADRFDRGIRAIGATGQQHLADTHVAVVGCGGLGDLIATELAMYGVGQFTLIDPDTVEASNLPRLVSAADHHVGRPKVEVTKQQVWRQHPDATVTTVQAPVEDAADQLHAVDLIVAGVDKITPRQWLNQYAVRHLTPYIDAGVIITTADTDEPGPPRVDSMDGYIQTVLPGGSACFTCLDRGDPEQARIERLTDDELEEEVERGYIEDTTLSPAPAVVPLNGMVASKTVQTVAQMVTGYVSPPDYLHLETVGNDMTAVNTTPRESCPVCGPNGVLGRGTRTVTDAELAADLNGMDLDTTAFSAAATPAHPVISSRAADAFAALFAPDDTD